MDKEDILNKSEDFANIDDLLGDNDDEDEKPKEVIKVEDFLPPEGDDGFDNDCQQHGLTISVPHLRVKDEESETTANIGKEKMSVFSSGLLDHLLMGRTELVGAAEIPTNLAKEGITDINKDMEKISEQIEERDILEGLRAGLGQKKKTEMKMRMRMGNFAVSSAKAKTLAEKRSKLQEDILKFGVAAIEKLYPRQGRKSTNTRRTSDTRSAYRMKPVPHDMHFEEVEASKIIRPYSHSKYIKQPEYSSVVYIHRKDGLVPLSTLCKESKTVISNNVNLLKGRNARMGKPGHYVRDKDRLVAIGGSRNKHNLNIQIVKVPVFEKETNKLPLFSLDDEYAEFAASAVHNKPSGKVDIREIKRKKKMKNLEIAEKISQKKSFIDQMMFKLNYKAEEELLDDESHFSSCMASFKEFRERDMTVKHKVVETKENDSEDIYKSFHIGQKDYLDGTLSTLDESQDLSELENDLEGPMKEPKNEDVNIDSSDKTDTIDASLTVANKWDSTPKTVVPQDMNLDECPPLRGYHEGSIKTLVPLPLKLNFDGYTGYDNCDVSGCFCKEGETTLGRSKNNSLTEFGTPVTGFHSGSQTPSGSKMRPQKIAKDLQRVKRALKTLGVKIIEFDEHDDCMDCLKDYCKFGCICDSLRTKQIPPSHCGKVECMFSCCCSKEALKYSSCGSRRVNISAAVGARIQEDSQRHMAVEERKFSNTVVVTASKDAVMLGGRGTRRERKVPQRYQNANTLMLDVTGKEYVEKEVSSESDMEYEEEKQVDEYERLRKAECLIPCTVILPMVSLPPTCSVWCMYHGQYSCPCYKYKNPLDYAPDVETGARNVAKRTLGNKFTTGVSRPTRKRRKSGEKEKVDVIKKAGKVTAKVFENDNHEVEEPLLGIEDIDPDWETRPRSKLSTSPQPSTVQHPSTTAAPKYTLRKGQSARTRGFTIKGSSKTRLPYQPKDQKKTDNSDLPEMVEIISVSDDSPDKNTDMGPAREGKDKLEVATELSVEIAPKSSCQYVRWDLFKAQFESGLVDLWFWVRPGRGKNMVFLTKGGEKPYIATAINLRNLQGSTQNLPSLVAECVKGVQARDRGRYTVLESNGTVWTVKSLLAIKGEKELGLSTDCIEDVDKKTVRKTESEKLKVKDGSIKISLSEPVQKLPVGQSLITVVEGPTQRAMMQVKLPPTLPSQYWSLISVGQGQSSIQCPDSSLVLKCAILQQAATLSTATSTTVRIPIPVGDQDPSFGVYAVPGLKSHVFVGPFASNEAVAETIEDDDDEIVCLEDDKENVKDEDVKIIEPKKEKDNEKEVLEKQRKNKMLLHNTKMLGQVPTVMDDEDGDDDVDIVKVIVKTKSQAKDLKKQNVKAVTDKPLPYYKLKPSEFGKIVMGQSKRNEDSGSCIEIKHKKGDVEDIFKAFLENNGKVILTHPKYPDHDVICPNISSAKSWLDEYFESSASNPEEEVVFEDPEPLPAEPPRIKTPPPVLKRIKTPSLPSGKSTSNIALFLQTKQQKDEAELFYELGHTAFNNFFQRNVSRAQILVKAHDEIKTLEEEGKKLELGKQALLKKRSKLFEDFTKTLNGLPVARKKAAVIELKELLKRDKEQLKASKVETVEILESGPSCSNVSNSNQSQQHSLYPGQTPYTDITGIKTVRADGSILRPMNAFMLWAKERRATMIAKGLSVSQVSQALSDQWRSLSEADRAQFYKEAEHLKNLHRLQHPDYKFSPRTVRNTTTPHSPPPAYLLQSRSPPPVSPNQPGDQPEVIQHPEPNQPPTHPHAHIQVPKPLSQLRGQTLPKHQSLLLPRPKAHTRPTPGLIPVQPIHHGVISSQQSVTKSKSTHFEVLNIPSRPNIKISSTFTPRVPHLSMTQGSRTEVEEVRFINQGGDRRASVAQLQRRQSVEHVDNRASIEEVEAGGSGDGLTSGTLNMQDIPQDAADVLGLAVQSSGLEEQQEAGGQFYSQQSWQEEGQVDRENEQQKEQEEGHQQFVIQGGKIRQRVHSQEQQFIQIGGDNYQLVEQEDEQQEEGQQLVLNQEQAQQLLLAQQQGQQLLLEQEQLMLEQEEGQQLLLDPNQHVFVDEQGRQVILSPDQQMMLQNQQMVQLEDGQQVMHLEEGEQMVQMGGQQLMQLEDGQQMVQLESGQQMVQLEGQDGQRVMVAYQEHGDLLFQTQGEDLDME